MTTIKEKLTERSKRHLSGCILWLGACSSTGYGIFKLNKKNYSTHRAAYQVKFGEIPDKLFVLHRCDVRSCVNPDHLFLGTNKENMEDKCGKERQARGEKDGNSKLTNDAVLRIRSSKEKIKELALQFGVHQRTIFRVKNRSIWKHI